MPKYGIKSTHILAKYPRKQIKIKHKSHSPPAHIKNESEMVV